MKCICDVLLHGRQSGANAIRWKYVTVAGRREEKGESSRALSLSLALSLSPGNLTSRSLPSNFDCEMQLAVKVQQNCGFASLLGIGVCQGHSVPALRSSNQNTSSSRIIICAQQNSCYPPLLHLLKLLLVSNSTQCA
jgi:hypothetical protein